MMMLSAEKLEKGEKFSHKNLSCYYLITISFYEATANFHVHNFRFLVHAELSNRLIYT